jgi:hypothetical protein
MSATATVTYATAPTQRVAADNGIEYAYHDLGDSTSESPRSISLCSSPTATATP